MIECGVRMSRTMRVQQTNKTDKQKVKKENNVTEEGMKEEKTQLKETYIWRKNVLR
jgi:hypothetical protein